jgi:hypothetical protein
MAPRLLAFVLTAATLAVTAAAPAVAETRCVALGGGEVAVLAFDQDLPTARVVPDSDPAVALCRSESGAGVRVLPDGLGRLAVRDADGDLVYGHTDGFGVTTFRPDDRRTLGRPDIVAGVDALGRPVIRDATGAVHHPSTDGFGNSTVRTDDGLILRCFTDPAGVTVCD